ncbi:hypothetical protein [Vibrio coralliilyticus]|uniref:Uncharacterized protein n=1 Tax=Vibrio coralliilyticus TaxID=190893 RepID=A0AAP6ZIT6_9VIBR|nr:hypothetical protein [Vibrio coralliilyticus]NOJ22189.1 hypothetical protein [Vibrio coralliilyticus]
MDYDPLQSTKIKILALMKQEIAAIRQYLVIQKLAEQKLAEQKLAEQNNETDGFHLVTTKQQTQVSNTLTEFSDKAGAVFGGIDIYTGKAVSRIGYSGGHTHKQKQKMLNLRDSLKINKNKNTFCAEEKIIATSPFIKFYYACPFYIDNWTLYNLEPCGLIENKVPQSGCKLLLHGKKIQYLTMEKIG